MIDNYVIILEIDTSRNGSVIWMPFDCRVYSTPSRSIRYLKISYKNSSLSIVVFFNLQWHLFSPNFIHTVSRSSEHPNEKNSRLSNKDLSLLKISDMIFNSKILIKWY
ncbi:hypothetical protein CEXT_154981 [Caerostris extrusa]|uniref:Uncharacterized protein n=1 Tax=Caerostris extrusa TaxID=172846 RepID=A0AAV4S6W9_CAEEX|nr:hypothetical protein CEXT_154981 [Caerostris extrusa]